MEFQPSFAIINSSTTHFDLNVSSVFINNKISDTNIFSLIFYGNLYRN